MGVVALTTVPSIPAAVSYTESTGNASILTSSQVAKAPIEEREIADARGAE